MDREAAKAGGTESAISQVVVGENRERERCTVLATVSSMYWSNLSFCLTLQPLNFANIETLYYKLITFLTNLSTDSNYFDYVQQWFFK